MPQSLNRYAATSLGPVGVAEGAGNTISLDSPTAWLGLTANLGLAYAGSRWFVQQGKLALRGSPFALKKSLTPLIGTGASFDVVDEFMIGGRLGEFAIGASGWLNPQWSRKLTDKLLVFEVATQGDVGIIERLGSSRFRFNKFAGEIDASGLRVTNYQRGLLLGDSKALSALLGAGVTGVIDAGYELFSVATGTGRWGNPYWTPRQKIQQSLYVVGSDVFLAAGLAFVNPYFAIPLAFLWAVKADDIFASLPYTSQFYDEKRNLQPLSYGN